MKDLKKVCNIAGFLCLISTMFAVGGLLLDLYYFEHTVIDIIFDSVHIALSLFSCIVYFVFAGKSTEEIINAQKGFFWLMILNIFNGLIVWAVSFWVNFTINKYQIFSNADQQKNENVIDVDEVDKELVKKLEELKELLDKNLISEEEYENLRQEAIKKFMN